MADPGDPVQLPALAGVLPPDVVRSEFERLHEAAVDFEAASTAKNTQIAYQRAWTRFEAWCRARGVPSLPTTPAVVRLYATDLVTTGIPHADGTPAEKPGSLQSLGVHLSAISYAHTSLGQDSPTRGLPRAFRQGLKRQLARAPKKKQWVSAEQLASFVEGYGDSLRAKRDRAMLLVAFNSGGRRRSEVTGMHVEHLRRTDQGDFVWSMPRTKTHGDGFTVVILKTGGGACAAGALEAWLAASGIRSGPVFRAVREHAGGVEKLVCREVDGEPEGLQPRHVATLVQRAANALGLDPREYGGHSLRAGFLTDMARDGHRIEDLMARSGHASVDIALGYVRVGRMLGEEDPFRKALAKKQGGRQ